MARKKNLLDINGGFNVKYSQPIDSRSQVEYKSDLIDESVWKSYYLYKGMKVLVLEDFTTWILTDPDNFTDASAWKEDTGSGGGSTLPTVTVDLDNEIESVGLGGDLVLNVDYSAQTCLHYYYNGVEEKSILDGIYTSIEGGTKVDDEYIYSAYTGNAIDILINIPSGTTFGEKNRNNHYYIRAKRNDETYTRTADFTIFGVKDGKEGTSYRLSPDVACIKLVKEGSVEPKTLYCRAYEGKAQLDITSEDRLYSVFYNYSGETAGSRLYDENGISLDSTTSENNITLYLVSGKTYSSDYVYDRETIPYVKDGEIGADGKYNEYCFFTYDKYFDFNKVNEYRFYDSAGTEIYGAEYQTEECLPARIDWENGGKDYSASSFTDDAISVSDEVPYQYAVTRYYNGENWGDLSTPYLWTSKGQDGEPGAPGTGLQYKGKLTAVYPSGHEPSATGYSIVFDSSDVTGGTGTLYSGVTAVTEIEIGDTYAYHDDDADNSYYYICNNTSTQTWDRTEAGGGGSVIHEKFAVQDATAGTEVKVSVNGELVTMKLSLTEDSGEQTGPYRGTYIDFKQDDSTAITAYTWVKWAGDDSYGREAIYAYTLTRTAPTIDSSCNDPSKAEFQVPDYCPNPSSITEGDPGYWYDKAFEATTTRPYVWTTSRTCTGSTWGAFDEDNIVLYDEQGNEAFDVNLTNPQAEIVVSGDSRIYPSTNYSMIFDNNVITEYSKVTIKARRCDGNWAEILTDDTGTYIPFTGDSDANWKCIVLKKSSDGSKLTILSATSEVFYTTYKDDIYYTLPLLFEYYPEGSDGPVYLSYDNWKLTYDTNGNVALSCWDDIYSADTRNEIGAITYNPNTKKHNKDKLYFEALLSNWSDNEGGDVYFSVNGNATSLSYVIEDDTNKRLGYGLSVDTSAYSAGSIHVEAVYKLNEESDSDVCNVVVVPSGLDGDGKAGLQGAVLRGPVIYTAQTSNRRWCNGTSGGTGYESGDEQWKDVMLYNGTYYVCVTSYDDTIDETAGHLVWDSTKANYWTEADEQYNFVAADVLLATNGSIKFLGTNQLTLMNADGTEVTGGAMGQSGESADCVAFWAGSSAATTDAPFSVTHAGALKSTSGKIGGMEVSGETMYINQEIEQEYQEYVMTSAGTQYTYYAPTDYLRHIEDYNDSDWVTMYSSPSKVFDSQSPIANKVKIYKNGVIYPHIQIGGRFYENEGEFIKLQADYCPNNTNLMVLVNCDVTLFAEGVESTTISATTGGSFTMAFSGNSELQPITSNTIGIYTFGDWLDSIYGNHDKTYTNGVVEKYKYYINAPENIFNFESGERHSDFPSGISGSILPDKYPALAISVEWLDTGNVYWYYRDSSSDIFDDDDYLLLYGWRYNGRQSVDYSIAYTTTEYPVQSLQVYSGSTDDTTQDGSGEVSQYYYDWEPTRSTMSGIATSITIYDYSEYVTGNTDNGITINLPLNKLTATTYDYSKLFKLSGKTTYIGVTGETDDDSSFLFYNLYDNSYVPVINTGITFPCLTWGDLDYTTGGTNVFVNPSGTIKSTNIITPKLILNGDKDIDQDNNENGLLTFASGMQDKELDLYNWNYFNTDQALNPPYSAISTDIDYSNSAMINEGDTLRVYEFSGESGSQTLTVNNEVYTYATVNMIKIKPNEQECWLIRDSQQDGYYQPGEGEGGTAHNYYAWIPIGKSITGESYGTYYSAQDTITETGVEVYSDTSFGGNTSVEDFRHNISTIKLIQGDYIWYFERGGNRTLAPYAVAPTRIYENGMLITNHANISSGVFRGRIEASEGTFNGIVNAEGGSLNNVDLSSSHFDGSIDIKENDILKAINSSGNTFLSIRNKSITSNMNTYYGSLKSLISGRKTDYTTGQTTTHYQDTKLLATIVVPAGNKVILPYFTVTGEQYDTDNSNIAYCAPYIRLYYTTGSSNTMKDRNVLYYGGLGVSSKNGRKYTYYLSIPSKTIDYSSDVESHTINIYANYDIGLKDCKWLLGLFGDYSFGSISIIPAGGYALQGTDANVISTTFGNNGFKIKNDSGLDVSVVNNTITIQTYCDYSTSTGIYGIKLGSFGIQMKMPGTNSYKTLKLDEDGKTLILQ